MEKIIPRWEWRTFADDLGEAEKNIRAHQADKTRESAEIYILSQVSGDNTKIRDALMDIKTLQQVNDDLLEQWLPVMKASFPILPADIEKVFKCLKVVMPKLARDSYTYEQYMTDLIKTHKLLKPVDVLKKRTGFKINGTIVEVAEVKVNDRWTKTAAVEFEDPIQVLNTVKELGLNTFENINYIRGLKKTVGMKY